MFYLVVFFILLVLAMLNARLADRPGRYIPVGVAAFVLVMVAGLRYETGGDWDTYSEIFRRMPTLGHLSSFNTDIVPLEIGFMFFVSLVKTLGGTLQTIYFLVACFNVTLITKALCRYTKYPGLGLLCYYGILFFSLDMIYTRQAIAVAMCFYALHCVEDKQPIRFLAWVAAAMLFHRVAVVMLVLYPVLSKRFPIWVYAAVVLLGAAVMALNIPWVKSVFTSVSSLLGAGYASKAQDYTAAGSFSVSRTISLGFVLNLLIMGFLLLFKERIQKRPHGTVHFNMFTLSLVLYYYCYELVEVSNRFRLFFLISIVALLPLMVEVLSERIMRIGAFLGVALYSFSFAMGIMLEKPQAAAYNPYQNYIIYKMENRKSTGKQRLEQSENAFRSERAN